MSQSVVTWRNRQQGGFNQVSYFLLKRALGNVEFTQVTPWGGEASLLELIQRSGGGCPAGRLKSPSVCGSSTPGRRAGDFWEDGAVLAQRTSLPTFSFGIIHCQSLHHALFSSQTGLLVSMLRMCASTSLLHCLPPGVSSFVLCA